MEKENDYISILTSAQEVFKEKPYLLSAFVDYMDVNYKDIDPILQKSWEHNAMLIIHHEFMKQANNLKMEILPQRSKELDELINTMKLLAQIVDLQLLPKPQREEVEEWAKRYKAYFLKTP